MSLTPFTDHHAIQTGEPMPCSVYGADRKLLLAKGVIVASERLRALLASHAKFTVPPAMDTGAAELPPPPAPEPLGFSASRPDDTASTLPAQQDPFADLIAAYACYGDRSRLQMKIARGEGMKTYETHVVGVLYDTRCLILTAPAAETLSPGIASGEVWLCRLFNTTTVFRFSGKMQTVDINNAPHLLVELPHYIDQRVVRRRPRALTSLPVHLHRPDGEPAVAIDLSTTGVRLGTRVSAQLGNVGDTFFVYMRIPAIDRMFSIQAKARITSASGPTDKRFPDVHFYGAEFERLNDLDALALYGYVKQHIAEEFDRLSDMLARS